MCWRTGFAETCTPAGISPTCCSVKFRTEELGFGAELVLLELRQELLSTGGVAIEVGDSIICKGVIWKAGMLTAFSSDAVTGMTPETENQILKGIKNEVLNHCVVIPSPQWMNLAHNPLSQTSVGLFDLVLTSNGGAVGSVLQWMGPSFLLIQKACLVAMGTLSKRNKITRREQSLKKKSRIHLYAKHVISKKCLLFFLQSCIPSLPSYSLSSISQGSCIPCLYYLLTEIRHRWLKDMLFKVRLPYCKDVSWLHCQPTASAKNWKSIWINTVTKEKSWYWVFMLEDNPSTFISSVFVNRTVLYSGFLQHYVLTAEYQSLLMKRGSCDSVSKYLGAWKSLHVLLWCALVLDKAYLRSRNSKCYRYVLFSFDFVFIVWNIFSSTLVIATCHVLI